jgi:hypothetical protein
MMLFQYMMKQKNCNASTFLERIRRENIRPAFRSFLIQRSVSGSTADYYMQNEWLNGKLIKLPVN